MASWLISFWYEQQESEKRKEQAERLARESELVNLRQQLHPHFLFNSLNSISALVGTRPEEARKMVQQLSDFLRGSLKKDDLQMSTFEEELQYLSLYLDIEKVRFGHRLQVDIQSDETIHKMQLPPLLLQPVVENAIKFGLYDTIGDITIRIHTRREQGMLVVEVSNPFDPETAIPQKGTGFGLSSVRRRLFLLFSRNDLLTVSQDDKIFLTTIRIPQHD
jgi:LytS/YehU family sensor histidine kinase